MAGVKRILVIMAGFLLLGCSMSLKQPVAKIETYTLEYDSPVIQGMGSLPYVIAVDRFSVAPLYDTVRMVYRDRAFKRDAYAYHQWRVNPGDLVTFFLSRDLKNSGLFRAVLSDKSRLKPSFVLEGSVDEWVEWEKEEDWNAVLTLGITLIAADEPDTAKRILFQKSYGATEPCERKTPRAYAESMSVAMSRVSERIILDIHDVLVKKKPV